MSTRCDFTTILKILKLLHPTPKSKYQIRHEGPIRYYQTLGKYLQYMMKLGLIKETPNSRGGHNYSLTADGWEIVELLGERISVSFANS